MTIIANIILGFLGLWCIVYFLLYAHESYAGNKNENIPIVNEIKTMNAIHNNNGNSKELDSLATMPSGRIPRNPILSYSCSSYINEDIQLVSKKEAVAAIVTVSIESKGTVLRTIASLLVNSIGILDSIYLVDDSHGLDIKDWVDWHTPEYTESVIKIIHLRPTRRLGLSAAKSFGVSNINDNKITVLAFVDGDSVVSADWLYPLVNSLRTHHNSVVYPAVDVLIEEEESSFGVVKGDRVVASFDWSLTKKWMSTHPDLKGTTEEENDDDNDVDEAISPSVHSTFVVDASFFKDIGGYDSSLVGDLADIELSLRVWLCGGNIIRQPCSRIAQQFPSFKEDVSTQISRHSIDKSVIATSHRWMAKKYRELVFQSRFTHRIPEKVSIALDNLHPEKFTQSKLINQYECLTLDWYLSEVHPSLAAEIPAVESNFKSYISSNYLDMSLKSLLDQYVKKSEIIVSPSTITKLAGYSAKYFDKDALDQDAVQMRRRYLDEEHYYHQEHIKDTLLCEDESFFGAPGCDAFKLRGGCTSELQYAMFGCPKTCEFCDTEGKICIDFYMSKCPLQKAQGDCESNEEYMQQNCRMSCGLCHRGNALPAPTEGLDAQPKSLELPAGLGVDESRFDPYLIHRRFLSGELPDATDPNACSLNNRPNGDLLSRIITEKVDEAMPKVFCGIYTMESNHGTNVKSTMETWAKRCDGFIAFSTLTDLSVSAMKIDHDGVENYNNMWQKSRSIWKYIASHYMNDFDYFLLGGDDMFYIIENLKYYLNSEEVRGEAARGKGIYIGRKFQPPGQKIFNSGGAGYILDKVSLKLLGDNLDAPSCHPKQVGFWEDVNIASCLKVSNDIDPYDTRDSLKRERFHPFTPGQHLTYKIPPKSPDWYAKYNPDLTLGYDCCSDHSISFHYVPHDLMRQMYNYVYLCTDKIIRDNQYP